MERTLILVKFKFMKEYYADFVPEYNPEADINELKKLHDETYDKIQKHIILIEEISRLYYTGNITMNSANLLVDLLNNASISYLKKFLLELFKLKSATDEQILEIKILFLEWISSPGAKFGETKLNQYICEIKYVNK